MIVRRYLRKPAVDLARAIHDTTKPYGQDRQDRANARQQKDRGDGELNGRGYGVNWRVHSFPGIGSSSISARTYLTGGEPKDNAVS